MFVSMTASAMVGHIVMAGILGCLVGGLVVYGFTKGFGNVKNC